jgi:hypothetical protein
MNFGGSRLGFWFRYPLGTPDRELATKRVLVFYDEYTDGPGGNTNYYNTVPGEPNPGTDVWPVIQAQEISLGMQPELIVGYQNLPADLTVFAHLWDIGYASPYVTNPIFNPTNLLFGYIQAGGAMFMLGENANFGARDDAIDTFVTYCGGGNITRSPTDYNFFVVSTVEPEFLLANNNNVVTFNRPGTFVSLGTGTAMSTAFIGTEYPAVCWKTGSLSNAPRGAITSVLDINIFVGASIDNDFIDNLSLTLNQL